MGAEPKKKGSMVVTAVLAAVTLGILIVGSKLASTQISPYKAGYLLGGILLYAVIATVVLGGILKSLGMPHPWTSGSCVVSLLAMFILIWQSHAQARAESQLNAGLAIEHSLLSQFANDELIVPTQYPEVTYGDGAITLTIINRELVVAQHKKFDIEAKQKTVGALDIDSPETFVDANKRSETLKKIVMLKEINMQNKKNAHDFLDAIHADVEASSLSEVDKRDFLGGFDKSVGRFIGQVDEYCDSALEIDRLSEDMLNIAAADKPRLVKGRLIFSNDENSKRFQEDSDKMAAAAEDIKRMRATMMQTVQDAAPYLKN